MQGQTDSSSRSARPTGPRERSMPTAPRWPSTGSRAATTAATWETDRVQARVGAWFDRYLKGDESAGTGPGFRVSRTLGSGSGDGEPRLEGVSADSYPGLGGEFRPVELRGREQSFDNPAGASPPAVSALPGIGGSGGLSQLSSLGLGVSWTSPASSPPSSRRRSGRTCRSPAPDRDRPREVHPRRGRALRQGLRRRPRRRPAGAPSQLVTPIRVTDAGAGKDVRITPAGRRPRDRERPPTAPGPVLHRPRLRLTGRPRHVHRLPQGRPEGADGTRRHRTGGRAARLGLVGAPREAAVAAVLLLTARRRTTAPPPDPALAEVPLQITDLSKRYAKSTDRYAVRDLSFRVEKGQVLGLLGPNGAGKTTTLRMLMGLIAPDGGDIRVFGHAIAPGAPVLSRVGAFVEGAGFPAAPVRPREPGAVLAGHRPPARGRPPRRGPGDRRPR